MTGREGGGSGSLRLPDPPSAMRREGLVNWQLAICSVRAHIKLWKAEKCHVSNVGNLCWCDENVVFLVPTWYYYSIQNIEKEKSFWFCCHEVYQEYRWMGEEAFGVKLSDMLSQEMHESSYICEGKTSTEILVYLFPRLLQENRKCIYLFNEIWRWKIFHFEVHGAVL